MSLGRTLQRAVPEPLRRSVRKARNLAAREAGTLRTWFFPSVFAVAGPEKGKGERLSFLYCGDDVRYRSYIGLLAFGPEGKSEDLGRMPVWKLRNFLKEERRAFDAAWIEWNPVSRVAFKLWQPVTLPRWVEAWLDIPDSPDEFKKKRGFRDIARQIRKQGYSYEVTRDRKLLDHFYHSMYEPTIRVSHGECAYIISYSFFERLCSCSDLLLVTQNGKPIGGGLIQYEDGEALFAYMGLEGGDRRLVRDGASGAIYYFAMDWLRSRGYSRFSLGGSKSFLNDGVLTTKMRKDGYVRTPKLIPHEQVMLAFLENGPALRDFLVCNPFLRYCEEGTIEAVLFADPSMTGDGAAAEAMLSPYLKYGGVDGWRIFTFDSAASGVSHMTGPKTGAKITIEPFAVHCAPGGLFHGDETPRHG